MTFKEGYALACEVGLENEYVYAYNHSTFENESMRVNEALREWDI